MKIAAVLLVWALFALGAALAVVLFPLAWWADNVVYAKNILRTLDRTTAAVLGFTGDYTVSAECGSAPGGWQVALRKAIDALLGEGHCAGAAKRENLTKGSA